MGMCGGFPNNLEGLLFLMSRTLKATGRKSLIRIFIVTLLWLATVTPAFADIIYTVEDGDSAWSIAVHFGISLEDLYLANGWADDENPVLQPGQRVSIPTDRDDEQAQETVETEESAEESEPAVESDDQIYIVQPGDNPYMIAHRFGFGTLVLLEYNGLTENDLIHPGDSLLVPPDDYEYQGTAEVTEEEESDPIPEPLHYFVQAGDNPWLIARSFGINTQTLLAYNNLELDAVLHIGDELLIPADAGSLSSRSGSWVPYTVAINDTLSVIAQNHGLTSAALAEANNITVNGILREGQQLMVPGQRTAPSDNTPATPPEPSPAEDLSGVINPLPSIGETGNQADNDGWHSEMFDFTRICAPEPSSTDPNPVSDGGLTTNGYFEDGTPYHTYTVRRGDTISEVAEAFGITQSDLISRNGLDIRSSLRIGRDLKIPLPRPAAPSSSSGAGNSSDGFSFGAPDVELSGLSGTDTGRAVVEEAVRHLGTPYVWAGTSLTGGADCSGFTMSVYAQFGVNLPHSSRDQATCGTDVPYADMLPGDLVFFHTTRSGISHVGLYIGNGDFVHSSSHRGGVVISPIDEGYYNSRFVCARRVL